MKEVTVKKYCERCKKETVYTAMEDALEIEYRCMECDHKDEIVKSFF